MPTNSFNTQFIGQQFVHLSVCDSTNAVVMQKLASSPSETRLETRLENGAIVMADLQTAGRGQRGAKWDAVASLNLTCTVALFPNLDIQQQFYLNIITALAISDTLKPYLNDPLKIKWPNDIYYYDYKLCGILVQNNLRVNMIQSSAIGIGLNVNQLHFENARAISLKSITKTAWERVELLKDIALHLEERYFQLKTSALAQLKQDYLAQLYRYNEWHTFEDQQGVFKGKITGIREDGQLLVNRGVETTAYDLKEITYIN